ncbi:hypothetical protein VTG60DRAFT_2563 [Thermothelomyces hinnuleus]
MGEPGQDSIVFDIPSGMGPAHSGSSNPHRASKPPRKDASNTLGSYLSAALAQGNSPLPQGQARTVPETIPSNATETTTAQELPTMLALNAAPPSPGQFGVLSAVTPAPVPSQKSSPPCSCLSDLVRVVQQLDDDEFRITTLSLDQVLHLQKWLIFQCCKPLDCPKCLDLPTIHTVRLIVCDRLTEMFECIHSRIKRAGAILASQQGSDSGSHSILTSSLPSSSASSSSSSSDSLRSVPQPPPWSAAVGSGPLPAQLFCRSSGRAANTVACNPLMFSDDFRSRYSDEEQVHMIRALLRLQTRDFRKLLMRLERACEGPPNQARRSKIESMVARLSKAAADTEDALRVVLRVWSTG